MGIITAYEKKETRATELRPSIPLSTSSLFDFRRAGVKGEREGGGGGWQKKGFEKKRTASGILVSLLHA